MLIDKLIEKAFCDGYEYAQKEFTSVRKFKKIAKNMWSADAVQTLHDNGVISMKEAMKANPIKSLKRTTKGGRPLEEWLEKNASKLPQKQVTKLKGGLTKHVKRLNKSLGSDLYEIY